MLFIEIGLNLNNNITNINLMSQTSLTKAKKLVGKGKEFLNKNKKKLKEFYGLPFNTLVFGLLESTGLGDERAIESFEKLKGLAGNKNRIPSFLAEKKDKGELDKLASEIGIRRDRFSKGIEEILRLDKQLNKRYKHDLKEKDLKHVTNPEEFYNDLKKVHGFKDSKNIRPWIACELVRVWGLRPPKNLELPERTKENLKKIGLNPSMFDVEDYPYVDFFFEIDDSGEPLRRLAKKDLQKFITEVERILKDC